MWTLKKILLFAIFYSGCMILLYRFYENVLLHKPENCSIRNMNLYEFERKCSSIINTYFESFFKNGSSVKNKSFQKWTLMAHYMYAYSAYFEKCPALLHQQYCIKFVGIVLFNISTISPFISHVRCGIKYNDSIYEDFTTIELLPENHKKTFTAAFLFCPVVSNVMPIYASFYSDLKNPFWMRVESSIEANKKDAKLNLPYIDGTSTMPNNLNLCVRPLYENIDFLQFSQFLLYYSLMGVDHFILYYTDSFKPLHIFSNFMKFSNLSFDILYWSIPLNNDLIHEYGQIAFTQDCVSRSKYKFKHTIIVDLDEYLVPQSHKNIKDLLLYLDSRNDLAASYVVPMALFCKEYYNENNYFFPFHVMNHRIRQKTVWFHHYRSKYILRPERVKYSGIHFTWKFEDKYHEVNISATTALINHYRSCCGMGQPWFFHLFEFKVLHDGITLDNSMYNYLIKHLNHPLFKFITEINCIIST